jgi:hypothetical protein
MFQSRATVSVSLAKMLAVLVVPARSTPVPAALSESCVPSA